MEATKIRPSYERLQKERKTAMINIAETIKQSLASSNSIYAIKSKYVIQEYNSKSGDSFNEQYGDASTTISFFHDRGWFKSSPKVFEIYFSFKSYINGGNIKYIRVDVFDSNIYAEAAPMMRYLQKKYNIYLSGVPIDIRKH